MSKKLNTSNYLRLNIEGSDKGCAFFALYAGLRMYYEQRKARDNEPNISSMAAAEAYCMLEDLRLNYPQDYKEAEIEYEEVYGDKKFHFVEMASLNPGAPFTVKYIAESPNEKPAA